MEAVGQKLISRQRLLFNTKKSDAKRKNIHFSLKFEEMIFPVCCPVFNFELNYFPKGKVVYNSPSFDRLDGDMGYTKSNVLIVSWKANTIKSFGSLKDLEKIVLFYQKLSTGGTNA